MYYVSPGDMSAKLVGRTRTSQALLDGPPVFLYRNPSTPVPVTFSITASAVESMDRAWLAENGAYGDREVGRWLLAHKSRITSSATRLPLRRSTSRASTSICFTCSTSAS